jgi:hypothetical protein
MVLSVLRMILMDGMFRAVGVLLLSSGVVVAMVVAVFAVSVLVAVVAFTVMHVLGGAGVHRSRGSWGAARHEAAPVLLLAWCRGRLGEAQPGAVICSAQRALIRPAALAGGRGLLAALIATTTTTAEHAA